MPRQKRGWRIRSTNLTCSPVKESMVAPGASRRRLELSNVVLLQLDACQFLDGYAFNVHQPFLGLPQPSSHVGITPHPRVFA